MLMSDSGFFSVRSILQSVTTVVLVSALIGCGSFGSRPEPEKTNTHGHKKLDSEKSGRLQKFLDSRGNDSSLTVPPDLLETSNDAISRAHADSEKRRSEAVLPDVVGAKIVSVGDRKWLEIETSADRVWSRLTEYWAQEQVGFSSYNPKAGIMETEWIEQDAPEKGSRGVAKALFSRVIGKGTAHDKFSLRLEKASENLTRVFVSHRATKKKEQANRAPVKLANFEWVEIADDPEKVAELLQIIVLIFDDSSLTNT